MSPARTAYHQQIAPYAPARFRFIDESGVNIAMTRLFGRARCGERVCDAVPKNHRQNVSVLGALSDKGIDAVMTIEGPVDGAVFRVYVEQLLIPTLGPGDVVIIDNLSAHKGRCIGQAIEPVGAHLFFLPPYSPELSPIEPCWSKLKTALRAAKARTRDALDAALRCALKYALETITPTDARGWFGHCGYALH